MDRYLTENLQTGILETRISKLGRRISQIIPLSESPATETSLERMEEVVSEFSGESRQLTSLDRRTYLSIISNEAESGALRAIRSVSLEGVFSTGANRDLSVSRVVSEDFSPSPKTVTDNLAKVLVETVLVTGDDIVKSSVLDRKMEVLTGFQSSNSRSTLTNRLITDNLALGYSGSSTLSYSRVYSNIFAQSTDQATSSILSRSFKQTLEASNLPKRNYRKFISVINSLNLQSKSNRQLISGRSTESGIFAGDALTSTSRILRSEEALFYSQTSFSRDSSLERALESNLSQSVLSTSSLVYSRQLSSQVSPLTSQFPGSIISRGLETAVSPKISEKRLTEARRALYENIGISELQGTLYQGSRSLNEGFSMEESDLTYSNIERSFSQILAGDTRTLGSSTTTRQLKSSLGFEEDSGRSLALTANALLDLGYNENLKLSSSLSRGLNHTFYQEPDTLTSLATERYLEMITGFGESNTRTGSMERSVEKLISYRSDRRTRSVLQRSFENFVQLNNMESGETRFIRSISSTFSISEASKRIYTARPQVKLGITAEAVRHRTSSLSRQLNEEFGFSWLFRQFISGYSPGTGNNSDGDSGGGQGSGGSGSGGFGGGGSIGGTLPDLPSNELSFSKDESLVKISPSEQKNLQLELENNGRSVANPELSIERDNFANLKAITLEQQDYQIPPESSVSTLLNVSAPDRIENLNNSERVLERTLVASGNESDTRLPVNIIVESSENELLDVRTELSDNNITSSRSTNYKFEILNLGESREVDILLYTTVTNSTNHTFHREKEEIAVQTSLSAVRDLDAELPPGKYKVKVRAEYADKDASAFSTLRINEERNDPEEKQDTNKVPEGFLKLLLFVLIAMVITGTQYKIQNRTSWQETAKNLMKWRKSDPKPKTQDYKEKLARQSWILPKNENETKNVGESVSSDDKSSKKEKISNINRNVDQKMND